MSSNAVNLFVQLYSQLVEKVFMGGTPKFQLMYPYKSWNWPSAPPGQISSQAYALLSQIPQWPAVGTYASSGTTVSQAYLGVLLKMQLTVPPEQQQAATDARNQITLAQNLLEQDLNNAAMAYQTYVNNLPPSVPAVDYATWSSQTGWVGTIAADQAAVAKAQATYNSIISQQNPQWQSAVNAVQPPDSIFTKKAGWTTMNQGDGNIVSVPNYNIEQDPTTWATLVQEKGGNSVTLALRSTPQAAAVRTNGAKGSLETGAFFFSIYSNGNWQQQPQMNLDTSIQVEVTIKAIEQIACGPDPSWYNGALLKTSNTPNAFYPPFTPTGGPSPMFGQGGVLPLIITSLVVGYQPSVKITMAGSLYNSLASQFQVAGGFRIGPFTFGGEGGSSSNAWTRSASNNSFTVQSTATYPFILGVVTSMPGLS
jgi:hypothetical protein